jgi:hypothetical protein
MSAAALGYVIPMSDGDERKGPPKPTAARRALAANVRHLRENFPIAGQLKGLSYDELAAALGQAVNAKTIRRLEDPFNDSIPRLETIDILADFFRTASWKLLQPPVAVSGKERQTAHTEVNSAAASKRSASAHTKNKSAKS